MLTHIHAFEFRSEFIHNGFALQIPNLNTALSGSAQPVAVGREDQGVNRVAGFQRVQVLAFTQIPEHDDTVFATRGTEGTIRADGDTVDVAGMPNTVGSEFAL